MARRSWRSFDFLLLGALFALSGYGLTMIYSATVNTLGLGNPVQRQLIFILMGTVLLIAAASVDYRLLDLLQHPFAILTPVVLALAHTALLLGVQAAQWKGVEPAPFAALLGPNLPVLALGAALVSVVFLADRTWIEQQDLALRRLGGVVLVVGATAVGVYLVSRLDPLRLQSLGPYFMPGGIAVAYLLDCLTLRFTDILRNPLYVLMLGLLGITLVVGKVAGGAQSWLGAGTVQPSEPAKVIVIVVLAKVLADREQQLERFSTVILSLAIVVVPVLLIYLQPDLGTALTLIPVWAAMMWLAGIRFRHLLILVAGGIAALPLAWFGLQDYMRDRLTLFVNPAGDPDSYFNVHQALVSIGSGGWMGKGLTHGSQSQLHFLRVRHTDFIFAVTAEELGFLGAVAMLALIAFVLWRMLRIAQQSRDTFGRLIAGGVAAVVLFQSVVNVGMNVGLLPVTGIPLPFVSYGGSSIVTLLVGMGLVESVAMRHKKLEFD